MILLKFKGNDGMLVNDMARKGEKKLYTPDEALIMMFNDLQECVEDYQCLPDEAFTHFKRNMRIIVLSEDNYERTSRILRGLIKGFCWLSDDYMESIHENRPIRTLQRQTEDIFFFLFEKILNEPAKERMRALFDIAKDYCFSLLASYSEMESERFFVAMYNIIVKKDSKVPHLNFWNAVPDRWNYSNATEREITGMIWPHGKEKREIYRNPDPFNLCAYFALCLLDFDKSNTEALKFIEAFKQYSEAVHRTTKVFPNNLSLNFTMTGNDIEKRRFFAPSDSKDINTKAAKKILLSLAKDEAQLPLVRYFCYEKVEQIAPAVEATRISKKKRKLMSGALGIKCYRYWSEYEKKGMTVLKGTFRCLLTAAIASVAFLLFMLWWSSELSNGFKAFWGGTPGFLIGICIVLGIILWGPWGQNVELVYVIGPGTGGPYFKY